MLGRTVPRAVVSTAGEGVRGLAFWATASLPFVYLPLLSTGDWSQHAGVVLALVVLNVGCLLATHRYVR